jgi:hypothetical protein
MKKSAFGGIDIALGVMPSSDFTSKFVSRVARFFLTQYPKTKENIPN